MYTNKNRGLSFIEVIVSISITLFLSMASYQIFKHNLKLLKKIISTHEKEKDIVALKTLLLTYFYDKDMADFRLINIKDTGKLLSFSKVFSNPSDIEGNCLILKYNLEDEKNKKIYSVFRCFLFINNNINIFYFDTTNLPFLRESNESILEENIKGSFLLKNNILIFTSSDLKTGDNYELMFYK